MHSPLSLAVGYKEVVTQYGAACNAGVANFTKARSRSAHPVLGGGSSELRLETAFSKKFGPS
jgi:hypothetical protein